MSKEQFRQLKEFALKIKPYVPIDERRKLTNQQKHDERVVENIRGKLNIYGNDEEVLSESLRQEGLGE